MKKITKFLIAIFAIFISFVFFSCSVLSDGSKGGITVTLPTKYSRAAAPENLSYYNVAVFEKASYEEFISKISTGELDIDYDSIPEDESEFGPEFFKIAFSRYAVQFKVKAGTGETLTFSEIDEGSYIVLVYAFDSENEVFAGGEAKVEVKAGKTAVANIKLKVSETVDGSGSVSFDTIPAFTLSVTDKDGSRVEDGSSVGSSEILTFSTSLAASDSYTYKWSINGSEVSGANSANYKLNLSDLTGITSVMCVVSCGDSKQSAGFTFKVVKAAAVIASKTALYQDSTFYLTEDISNFSEDVTNAYYQDFVFDANGNIYYINDGCIFRIINGTTDGIRIDTGVALGTAKDLAFDMENNTLYIACQDSEYVSSGGYRYNYNLYKIENAPTVSEESANPVELTEFLPTSNPESSDSWPTPQIAVFNGYLYAVYKAGSDYYLVKYQLGDSSIIEISPRVVFADLLTDKVPNYSTITDITFPDMTANINGIFVLMRNVTSDFALSDGEQTFYSRGAVINLSESLVLKSFEGWSTDSRRYTVSGVYNETTTCTANITMNSPSNSDSGTKFYGPEKFIAIKPKKLIFADDGVCIDASGVSTIGDAASKKNRVIEYDIAKKSFETTDVDADFELIGDVGYGTFFAATYSITTN